jgi:pyruvate/2-oxoglutarate dehydrogenase complex dihydrolipoamide dehydrogenase (E3) component
MYDVVVVGGGPAGVTAAIRCRELGAKVALVERYRLGGTCTNDGCVPTRVLAKAARLKRDAEQFTEYGLTPAEPEVDFAALLRRTQSTVYTLHEKKQLIEHLNQAGVEVITEAGSVSFKDAHTLALGNGSSLEADKVILCVGGRARRFNFPGSELAITHHDVWSLKTLPKSVAVVGGANTGCQLASIFNGFGSQTYLLEMHPRLIGVEDAAVSEEVTRAFQRRGIQVITGIGGLEKIEKAGQGLRLFYTFDGQSVSLDVEAVVLAVGWVGNVEDLNLEAVGVKTERGYIVVNDFQQSSSPTIFAAGDITGRMMLVQSATYEGRIAAENATLGIGQPYKHLIVPHGSFTDPEYAAVGLTEEQARKQGEIATATVPYHDIDRAVIDGHPEGLFKLVVSAETHRILGAHVVGEQAVEIVHLVAAGMAADMWVEQLAELEIAYPTYTAIAGLAARQIMRELGVVPLTPEWRTLTRLRNSEWERSEKA